uniref:Uncharacterized protein n=1 Tax=Bionectria ochroleuca TaxID=29856 RepID=A0A8H7K1S2_BIOOC
MDDAGKICRPAHANVVSLWMILRSSSLSVNQQDPKYDRKVLASFFSFLSGAGPCLVSSRPTMQKKPSIDGTISTHEAPRDETGPSEMNGFKNKSDPCQTSPLQVAAI